MKLCILGNALSLLKDYEVEKPTVDYALLTLFDQKESVVTENDKTSLIGYHPAISEDGRLIWKKFQVIIDYYNDYGDATDLMNEFIVLNKLKVDYGDLENQEIG